MADNDSRRASHFNQQRASLRSASDWTPSISSRPATREGYGYTRPVSRSHGSDSHDYENLDEIAAPSPVIRRSRQGSSWSQQPSSPRSFAEKERMRTKRGSLGRDSRPTSQQRVYEDDASPREFEALDEVVAPPPIDRLDRRWSLADERLKIEKKRATERQEEEEYALTALPGVEGARTGEDGTRRRSRTATKLYTISYLILFSILGTLARLGIQWLTFYPGAPSVFPVLWANFAGTFLIGYFSEDQRLFSTETSTSKDTTLRRTSTAKARHTKVKKAIPFYTGLTTGFCGSLTSFSSFMRDIFLALSNDLPSPINNPSSGLPPSTTSTVPRNGGYSVMALLAVIIITISVSYAALTLGTHVSLCTERFTPKLPSRALRRFFDPLITFLAWGTWLGALLITIWPPDRPSGPSPHGSWENETWRGVALFACLFAPVGCLARFYVSLYLNPIMPSFPLGTFVANIFGTAVLGMAWDLQHVRIGVGGGVGGGRLGCQALQGIMDGFCGALTTVSTWVLELEGLGRGSAYGYGGTSVVAGVGVLVVIMGSVRWSVGWAEVACVVGRS